MFLHKPKGKKLWIPRRGLVLDAQLWQPDKNGATITMFNHTTGATISATDYGATWVSQGRQFDGVDDYLLSSGALGYIPTGSNPRTILFWIKPTVSSSGKYMRICGYGTSATRRRWDTALNGTTTVNTQAIYTTGDDVFSDTPVTIGEWSFCGHTWAGAGQPVTFYLNGTPDGTKSFTGTPDTTTTFGLYIGRTDVGNYWTGYIGELRIYNRALSATEIQNIYLATRWKYV